MELAVFAGRIDYQKYRFRDRQMIRLIMWMTKGPTDPKTNIEFTNWNQPHFTELFFRITLLPQFCSRMLRHIGC